MGFRYFSTIVLRPDPRQESGITGQLCLRWELSRLRQTDQILQDHVPRPSNHQKVLQTIRFQYVLAMVLRPGPRTKIWHPQGTQQMVTLGWCLARRTCPLTKVQAGALVHLPKFKTNGSNVALIWGCFYIDKACKKELGPDSGAPFWVAFIWET
jgi:hypothetical protein